MTTKVPSEFLSTGAVVQVVSTTKTDTFSGSTTGSFYDITGLNVTITPSSASNKILINVTVCGGHSNLAAYRLVRGSTAIGVGDSGGGNRNQVTFGHTSHPVDGNRMMNNSMTFLDSPSTTSATTYKLQTFQYTGTNYVNRTSADTNASYTGRAISTITATEVVG